MRPLVKKQVLVFTLAPPLPAVTGGDIYAVNALLPFVDEVDYHLFCFVSGEEHRQRIEDHSDIYGKVFRTIHMEPRPLMPFQMSKLRRSIWMLWQVLYGLPFIDASYCSRSAISSAHRIVKQNGIDAIEVNSAHLAFFRRFLPDIPALLVSHNIESDIFPFWLPQGLSGWKLKFMEWVAARSRRAAKFVELENGFGFSSMTFISNNDLLRTRDNVPRHLMPLFFHNKAASYVQKKQRTDGFNVLWMGGFGWYPNAEGIIWFAEKVFPLVRERLREHAIILHFCGSHPPAQLQALHDGVTVHVHGFVDDIDPMIRDAHLMIVPLLSGGGIRVKIIEAMSSGVPVLSTSKGCEGIGAENGRNIIVRDDPEGFASEIVSASMDPERMSALSRAGLQLMAQNYSEDASLAAKRAAYQDIGVC
jgi:glycosyltransferase involved in cell wall biosynthesis